MKSKVLRELEFIKKQKRRDLRPEDVVEFAKENKRSELHRHFEWDDGAAADKYRLDQARNIIRVHVTLVTPPGANRTVSVSAFVSLPDNRGNGYESIVDVMNNEERSTVLLQDTIRRLMQIREISLFPELDDVTKAINKAADNYLDGGKVSPRKTAA